MKNTFFFFFLIILPICLYGQERDNKLFTELTYGYDLSTKNSYRRRIIGSGQNGAIGIIHNVRLGTNIGYHLYPRIYLFSGVKINMNTTPYSGGDEGNLFWNIFFSRKFQRDFYIVFPLRGRYYITNEKSSKWFIEGGFSFYQYITSYLKRDKEFKKDDDYYNQKYSLNFSLGKEWNRKKNRKLAFQLIARFQLNESLDANLSLVRPTPSHQYNHVGFEMRHSF